MFLWATGSNENERVPQGEAVLGSNSSPLMPLYNLGMNGSATVSRSGLRERGR